MESTNKTICHQEAQQESSHPAALIELEFANLYKEIQQETGQHEESLPPPSFREFLDFLVEFGQDSEQVVPEPSTSDLAPSPKKSQLSDYQPSTSQNLEDTSKDLDLFKTVDGEEITKLLKQFQQEMGVVASEPFESNMCPSLNRTKVSDYHPSTIQSMAGPSSVWSTATRESYIMKNRHHTKKPLNAYMLFWAEQRQRVALVLGIKDCAIVNMELGRRWKMLSKEEKAPYFEQALREKNAYQARYPDWSAKDNFAKNDWQRNTVAPYYHDFGFPANQQPWPYATCPTNFTPQAPYHQGPYYPTWGPSWGPYYQPGVPSQDPYHQPWGSDQGLYYQPGGSSQGPYHQPGGPNQGPSYLPGGSE